MKKLKLYLAHNLNDRHEIRKIEKELEKNYHIELVNPFYDIVMDDIKDLDEGKGNRYKLPMQRCIEVIKMDLNMILRCDGILAIIKSPSIGTTLEIAYAKQFYRKIYIISEKYSDHPWIKVYANRTFKTIKEFEKWLEKNKYLSKDLILENWSDCIE